MGNTEYKVFNLRTGKYTDVIAMNDRHAVAKAYCDHTEDMGIPAAMKMVVTNKYSVACGAWSVLLDSYDRYLTDTEHYY